MKSTADAAAHTFWGDVMAAEEPLREQRFPLVQVQTAIARRVIARYTGTPRRVLDAGAGTGRFSLPLAADGHFVTHLDVSAAMLQRAMACAARQGLHTIEFREGDVKRLDGLGDRSYDLTLCLDAPVSYAWPHHEQALAEVCRVTREVVVLMVSSRLGVVPFMVDYDLAGDFLPPGYDKPVPHFLMARGILAQGVETFPDDVRAWLEATGRLTPPDYAFTPEELCTLVEAQGFAVEVLGGPGALARSIRRESLDAVLADPRLFDEFIDLSMAFDFQPHALGLGGVNLLLVARRHPAHGKSRS